VTAKPRFGITVRKLGAQSNHLDVVRLLGERQDIATILTEAL
jgi:hypothetical protein